MNDVKSISQEVADGLAPMFEKAIKEGLWFEHSSITGHIFLSPQELKKNQEEGMYRWGAVNWKLVKPMIHLRYLKSKVTSAQSAVEAFKKRMQ